MALTADKLLAFVRDKMASVDVDGDTALFSTGALDSVNQLNLILFIEGEAGITINQMDITLDNFDSVNRIQAFVSTQVPS